MSKKILKCHSRYGEARWETDLGNGWYQVEGSSAYIRCGGLENFEKDIPGVNPDSLGMVDFDGGPYYGIGDTYEPGAEFNKLAEAKAWNRPGKIVGLYSVETSHENYTIIRINVQRKSLMASFKLDSSIKEELAEFKAIMQTSLQSLLESLAKQEHDQWMDWAKTLMEKEPGLTPERVARWQAYMVPYEELTEEVKEFDRVWARKSLSLLLESMLTHRLEDLIRNNKEQQQLVDELQQDIRDLRVNHKKAVNDLQEVNYKLQSALVQLKGDVEKLFTGAVDKATLARYIHSPEA